MYSAKITRPGYTDILRRERLFRRLDASREPLTWIAAPPGAGKTTLAASYLVERDLRHLWYQLDARDADPATFFHYLGLAVRAAAPRLQLALPHLTAEYALGLRAFARRYFEAFAAQLAARFALVFDNYHELPVDAPLHALLRDGIAALPAGFRTLVLSRLPPPAVHAAPARLGWEDLQLTLDEVEGIERLRKHRAAPSHRALHGESSGWAAGVVLLLEQEKGGVRAPQQFSASDPQQLFDHFAAEIFSRLERRTQTVLAASALLPKMSAAMLAELAAFPAAGELLEDLHRKNYFTLKHAEPPVYEYHPLFREFLLARARETFTGAQLQALRVRAAALAHADGQLETAAELRRAAGDFRGLAELITQHARELLEQGRGQVVETWLGSLPATMRKANPWLSYWHGACRLAFNPAEARDHFERAYVGFKAAGDTAGRAAAWCAVVDSYVFEWGNFLPLGRWLAEMEGPAAAAWPPEIEAQVACGMFLALMYCRPEHPQMRHWEERAREIILSGRHPALQVKVGNHLLIYYTWWIGDLAGAQALVESLRPQVMRPGTPPLFEIHWDAMASGYYWMRAANAECLARVEHGLETSRTAGVHVWERLLCSQGVFGSLSAGDAPLARRYLDRMEASLTMSRPMDSAMYHYHAAWYEFSQGRVARAGELARTAVSLAEQAGARFPAAVMRNDLARVLFHLGDKPGAFALMRQARDEGRAMRAQTIEYLTFLVEAEIALESGDEPGCLAALRAGLRVGAAQGFVNHTWWSGAVMARLYAKALEHGIEGEYVRDVIRLRAL